jgi:acyl carrier protein
MVEDSFINEFAGVLEVGANALHSNFRMDESVAWDSLAFISAIALVDKHYNMILDSDVLMNLGSFGELCDLLEKKVA